SYVLLKVKQTTTNGIDSTLFHEQGRAVQGRTSVHNPARNLISRGRRRRWRRLPRSQLGDLARPPDARLAGGRVPAAPPRPSGIPQARCISRGAATSPSWPSFYARTRSIAPADRLFSVGCAARHRARRVPPAADCTRRRMPLMAPMIFLARAPPFDRRLPGAAAPSRRPARHAAVPTSTWCCAGWRSRAMERRSVSTPRREPPRSVGRASCWPCWPAAGGCGPPGRRAAAAAARAPPARRPASAPRPLAVELAPTDRGAADTAPSSCSAARGLGRPEGGADAPSSRPASPPRCSELAVREGDAVTRRPAASAQLDATESELAAAPGRGAGRRRARRSCDIAAAHAGQQPGAGRPGLHLAAMRSTPPASSDAGARPRCRPRSAGGRAGAQGACATPRSVPPISGLVAQRLVQPGERVRAGRAAAWRSSTCRSVELEAAVPPGGRAARLRVGQAARVHDRRHGRAGGGARGAHQPQRARPARARVMAYLALEPAPGAAPGPVRAAARIELRAHAGAGRAGCRRVRFDQARPYVLAVEDGAPSQRPELSARPARRRGAGRRSRGAAVEITGGWPPAPRRAARRHGGARCTRHRRPRLRRPRRRAGDAGTRPCRRRRPRHAAPCGSPASRSHNPVLAVMVMLAFVVLGLFSYQRLAGRPVPEHRLSRPWWCTIGLPRRVSPEIVEAEVTKKVEEAVNTDRRHQRAVLAQLRGQARSSSSSSTCDIDGRKAAEDVREKVALHPPAAARRGQGAARLALRPGQPADLQRRRAGRLDGKAQRRRS
ncbi:MAG: hypothetical protein MZW92_04225, partial [Comamonadaceae bacterium]|nr:hypothetical protein [Comamonadaceae bacterium]